MQTIQKCFISFILSYKIREIQLFSVVPPTKLAQAISSVFSPKIRHGTNWQKSIIKMAVAPLRCDADSSAVLISLIISYKIRKNTN